MELMVNNYIAFKKELDTELNNAAESFVKIGYLLRMARDTNILAESGYKNVTEFAKAEYNLKPDQVTRFIQINERFGEGGRLSDKYSPFGYTKLVEMLQLPDAVNEMLTPEYTREDIRTIRKEIVEEKAITDLEVLMEEPDENEKLISILKQIAEEKETIRKNLSAWDGELEQLRWLLAPSGDNVYMARVRGIGKFTVSIKEKEDGITLFNIRTEEEEKIPWEEVATAAGKVKDMLPEEPPQKAEEEPKEEMKQKKVSVVKEKKNDEKRENSEDQGKNPEKREEIEKRTEPETESIRESDEENREEGKPEENAEERIEESPEESENVNERTDATRSGIPAEGDTGADESRKVPEQHEDPEEDGRGKEEGNSAVKIEEIAPAQILPAPVNTEADRQLTRKEYMDDLTEYGLADYLHKEYISKRLTGGMLVYPEKLEEWLSEPVTEKGMPIEEEEDE